MDVADLIPALPGLIFTYWALAAGAAIIALIPLPFAKGFRSAVLLSACRGKLMDSKPANALGPLSNWTVPQRWFWHFYALGAGWTALLAVIYLNTAFIDLPVGLKATVEVSLVLLEVHLVRRLVETVALLRYPPHAKMHGIAYLFGVSYYLLVPLSLLPEKSTVDMGLALATGTSSLLHLQNTTLLLSLKQVLHSLLPIQLLGICVFLFGNALQFHSHLLFARMSSSSGRYKIPKGGAFEVLSCPHYFGEIVIYLGLLLVNCGRYRSVWMMFIWVVANLLLAGGMTHTWYKQQFKTYPKSRKAIVPWIY